MSENEIINAFGGTSAVARIFEITPGAVSQWRTDGIPKDRVRYLKLLNPRVFGGGVTKTRQKNKAIKDACNV